MQIDYRWVVIRQWVDDGLRPYADQNFHKLRQEARTDYHEQRDRMPLPPGTYTLEVVDRARHGETIAKSTVVVEPDKPRQVVEHNLTPVKRPS